MRHHVYTRRDYDQPLAELDRVESDEVPDVTTAVGDDHDWLEVAVIPASAIVWVVRDGDLVDGVAEAPGEATA